MSQNFITAIHQDYKGFIWFGTKDGLNRYDGYNFMVFQNNPEDTISLSHNYITAICEGIDSALWVGTLGGGLCKFNRTMESFTVFQFISTNKHPEQQPMNSIGALYVLRDGTLLIGTERNGLCRYDPQSNMIVQIDIPGTDSVPVRHICEDRDGAIWFATSSELIRYHRTTTKTFRFSLGTKEPGGIRGSWITALIADSNGRLWVGTRYGIDSLDYHQMQWVPIPFGQNTDSSFGARSFIMIDRWLGILSESHFTVFESSTKQISLRAAGTGNKTVLVDRSGVMWIGTGGRGIYKFNPASRAFEPKKGRFDIEPFRSAIEEASRNLKIPFERLSSLPHSFLRDKKGNTWLNTSNNGIIQVRADGQGTKSYFSTAHTTNRRMIYEDRFGKIWFVSGPRLMSYDEREQRFRFFDVMSDPGSYSGTTQHQNFVCMFQDRNNDYWLGTPSMGLLKWKGNNEPAESFHFRRGDTRSLSNNSILCITEDPANPEMYLWIGTDGGGFNRLEIATGQFARFDVQDGLPSNVVYAILADDHGNLWMSTNKGISRFNPSTKTFWNYDVRDGLQGNEFNRFEWYKDTAGKMYFGGTDGFNVFHPDAIKDNPVPPLPCITGIRLINKPVDFRNDRSPVRTSIPETKELHLSYDQNMLTFEFVGMEYTVPEKNQYAYKLEGFDHDWIDAGREREATYTNLDPGEYSFRLKAANSSGVWSTEEATMALAISPPYWMTWWFRGSVFVILLVGIGGTIRYFELRKIREKMREMEHQAAMERERLRISRDMHDDVGSRLTRISLISDLVNKHSENPVKIREMMKDITDATRSVVTSFDEIVWAVNPRNDTLDGLTDYLAQYAADYLEKAGIECHLNLPAFESKIVLPSEVRHNVYMVLREGLNNAVKYSAAHHVWMECEYSEGKFMLTLRDDGNGFDTEKVGAFSDGLVNMRQRMEEIKGTFNLETSPGKGTQIRLSVPVT